MKPMVEGSGNAVEHRATEAIAHPERFEAAIAHYFETLNAGAFAETAALFAENGALCPPFETAVLGRAAIAQYLQTEARGIQLFPQRSDQELFANGDVQIKVVGRVQTPILGVHVAWKFILNPQAELLLVKVDLLATLEELLPFRKG